MAGDYGNNGWSEWSRHVLAELKRISTSQENLLKEVQDLEVETAKALVALQIKSGVWGALAGLIPIVLFLVWKLLFDN